MSNDFYLQYTDFCMMVCIEFGDVLIKVPETRTTIKHGNLDKFIDDNSMLFQYLAESVASDIRYLFDNNISTSIVVDGSNYFLDATLDRDLKTIKWDFQDYAQQKSKEIAMDITKKYFQALK